MKPIDNAVLSGMKGYIRVSESGGMPLEEAEAVIACVENAARLGYFTMAMNDHAEAMFKCLEKNAGHRSGSKEADQ